jgi:CheY-like chemotaxis protein
VKKILIAEDDKFLANAYRLKLTKAGYEVVVAVDGKEALGTLAGFEPDLILLDLVMPKMDGFAVLEQLRKNPAWANIPIIVASNLGQMEDIERAKKLGATDYVLKSDMSMAKFVDKIKSVLHD